MTEKISRRHFLRGSAATALTAVAAGGAGVLSPQKAAAEPISITLLLTAIIAGKQIYEITVADPRDRRNLRQLGANLDTFAQQQNDILDELENVQILLQRELRNAFLNEDLRDLKTLAGQLNMYTEIGADADTLDVAASHANMVTSRLGQYEDYAAFPALANACAVQMALQKMRGATAVEQREILRQQQRSLGQWTDFEPIAGVDIIATKLSDGNFKVWRQYEYTPDFTPNTGTLREDDIITAIDGRSVTDMDATTFQDLLKGPAGSTVTLQVTRSPARPQNIVLEREYLPQSLDEDGEVPLKKLDQDIHDLYERLAPQIAYLKSMDGHDFRIAEYIYEYTSGGSNFYEAYDSFVSLNLTDENAIHLEQELRSINSRVCEPGEFRNNSCADMRYRYTYNRSGKALIYHEMAGWQDTRTGCLVSDDDDYEYWTPSQVERYIDGREQCLRSHFETHVETHDNDLRKLRKLLEIKLAMQILSQSVIEMDLGLQQQIERDNQAPTPAVRPNAPIPRNQ